MTQGEVFPDQKNIFLTIVFNIVNFFSYISEICSAQFMAAFGGNSDYPSERNAIQVF